MRDLMRVAMIQPAVAQAHEVPKGLEGVVVADTTVGDVRGLEGFYHYRQYSAVDLAQTPPARRRLVPAVQRASSRRRSPSARRSRPTSAPARAIPAAVAAVLPAIAARGRHVRSARRARAPRSRSSARRSASDRRSTSTTQRSATTRCRPARSRPTLICALVAPAPGARAGRAAPRRSATRPTTST